MQSFVLHSTEWTQKVALRDCYWYLSSACKFFFNSSYRQQVTQVKQHKDKSSAPTTLATAGIYHLHGAKKKQQTIKNM